MHRTTARAARLVTVVAGVLCGSLVLAGPAAAACTVTSSFDDGTAETTADLDYSDDTFTKTLNAPVTAVAATSATLTLRGTAYGGCGSYLLTVNGAADHTFNTCQAGWQTQPITTQRLSGGLNVFGIEDTDFTWDTGIFFDVDTGSSGFSTIVVNGGARTGELMWRLTVTVPVCV